MSQQEKRPLTYTRTHPYQPEFKDLQRELGLIDGKHNIDAFAGQLWQDWRESGCDLTPLDIAFLFNQHKKNRRRHLQHQGIYNKDIFEKMSLFDLWLYYTNQADRHLFDHSLLADSEWYKSSFDQLAALVEEAMFLPNQENQISGATWAAYWRFTEEHWENEINGDKSNEIDGITE